MTTNAVTPNPNPALPPIPTVPMLDPSGTPRQIPVSQSQAALQAGGKVAYKLIDPTGTPRWIGQDSLQAAVDAGGKPADMHEAQRIQAQLPPVQAGFKPAMAQGGAMGDLVAGFTGEAAKTYVGLDDGIRKLLGMSAAPKSAIEQSIAGVAGEPNEDATQSAGGMGENAAEFMAPSEYLEMLEGSAKGAMGLERAAKLSKFVQANPRVGALLRIGYNAAKNAAIAGAQTGVKTEDPAQAAEAAGTTGAFGAGIEGALGGLGRFVGRNATTIEDVGGVPTKIPAEVRNARPTPQQEAGQESIRNAARDSLGRNLEEVNQSRTVAPEPKALAAKSGPFEFNLRGTPPVETHTGESVVPAAKFPRANISDRFAPDAHMTSAAPVPGREGYTGEMGADTTTSRPRQTDTAKIGGAGTLTTQDPNVATAHVAALNEIIDGEGFDKLPAQQQQQILEARSDAQKQLGVYHQQVRQTLPGYGKPNFDPIDIPTVTSRVGSFSEAANTLEKTATDGYEHFNDITGGRFNAVRQANKDAWAAYKGASGVEAQQGAEQAIDRTNREMDELMQSVHGAVSPKELSGFNEAYRNAQIMRYVANAVDGSFTGNASASARSWEYRGLNGNRMMSSLSRLAQKKTIGRPALERVVGRDNLNTLFQVAELNRTNAARATFGAKVQPIVDYVSRMAMTHATALYIGGHIGQEAGVGWLGGAIAGEGTALATTKVMQTILTNPKIAKNLLFAIDSGARPQNYGPLIGAMVGQAIRSQSSDSEQQPTEPDNKQQP